MKYSTEQLRELKERFDALQTIDEKLEFWMSVLSMPYYMRNSSPELLQFLIVTNTTEATLKVNKYNLELYKSRLAFSVNRFASLAEYAREEFFKTFAKYRNQKFVDEELNKVDITLSNYPRNKNHIQREYCKALFVAAFNDAYYNGNYPDYSVEQYDFEELIAVNDGFELSEYRKQLEELTKILEDEERRERKTTPLNHQVLLLHYLGLIDIVKQRMPVNQDRAALLAVVLNQDFKNVKTLLERPELIRDQAKSSNTKEYLNQIKLLFDKVGLTEQSNLVKLDIDKYYQEKLE